MSNNTPEKSAPKRMGRPSVVADAIPQFVEAVRVIEDGYDDLWRKEWDERIAGKAISTRAAYVSKYRTAVKDALGSRHPSLPHIKVLDRTESEEQLRTYTARSNAGRPGTRREAIETFTLHTKLLNDARELAVKEGKKTQRQADAIYKRSLSKLWASETEDWRGNIKPTTILSTTTQYRNALREANFGDDVTLSVIIAPEDVQKAVSTAYRDSVIEQHNELIAVPHWFEMVEAAKKAMPETDASWSTLQQEAQKAADSAKRADLVRYGVALGLLTGRRPYEIFCQGSIAPLPLALEGVAGRGYESWRVMFTGQAKTRGREGTQ
ncbi:protelomerase family protein, partial [Brucella sp. NBRC 113783]